MSTALPSTSLKKKRRHVTQRGDGRSGKKNPAVAGARMHPPGLAGSRPPVSGEAEWLSRPSTPEGQGISPQQVPISSCQPPLWLPPWPRASYLQKINGRGRGHVHLRGPAVLPTIERVAVLLGDLRASSLGPRLEANRSDKTHRDVHFAFSHLDGQARTPGCGTPGW